MFDSAARSNAQFDMTHRSNQQDKECNVRSIIWQERPHALECVLMCMGNVRQTRGLQVLFQGILSKEEKGKENTAWARRRLQILHGIW